MTSCGFHERRTLMPARWSGMLGGGLTGVLGSRGITGLIPLPITGAIGLNGLQEPGVATPSGGRPADDATLRDASRNLVDTAGPEASG
jgi:hypothetical protein